MLVRRALARARCHQRKMHSRCRVSIGTLNPSPCNKAATLNAAPKGHAVSNNVRVVLNCQCTYLNLSQICCPFFCVGWFFFFSMSNDREKAESLSSHKMLSKSGCWHKLICCNSYPRRTRNLNLRPKSPNYVTPR